MLPVGGLVSVLIVFSSKVAPKLCHCVTLFYPRERGNIRGRPPFKGEVVYVRGSGTPEKSSGWRCGHGGLCGRGGPYCSCPPRPQRPSSPQNGTVSLFCGGEVGFVRGTASAGGMPLGGVGISVSPRRWCRSGSWAWPRQSPGTTLILVDTVDRVDEVDLFTVHSVHSVGGITVGPQWRQSP